MTRLINTFMVGLALLTAMAFMTLGALLMDTHNDNAARTAADATAAYGAAQWHAQQTAQPQPYQPYAQGATP